MNILLIIDAQNDFVLPNGALPVAGAVEDMARLIEFINSTALDKIVLTMDSHRIGHIATAAYWTDKDGNPPAPFTTISYKDAAAGVWKPKKNDAIAYLKALEAGGKRHTIWQEHCIYDTSGWQLYQPLADAIQQWLYRKAGQLAVHLKGEQLDVEMFSAVMPEVSYDSSDEDKANHFLSLLDDSDKIYVAGEAENFCVKETVCDIVKMRPGLAPKMVILRHCMSAIPVGDDIEAFWAEMATKGVQSSTDAA